MFRIVFCILLSAACAPEMSDTSAVADDKGSESEVDAWLADTDDASDGVVPENKWCCDRSPEPGRCVKKSKCTGTDTGPYDSETACQSACH